MKHVLGIAADHLGWSGRFAQFAAERHIQHELFVIERGDWLDTVKRFDAILWRPNLDSPYCEEAREKIYFLETSLGKHVFPNWDTFWHYDNKRAQHYFFRTHGIRTPETFVSFSEEESLEAIERMCFPIVSKTSGGAGSTGVRLLHNKSEAVREAKRCFNVSAFSKVLGRCDIDVRWSSRCRNQYVLWQEFVQGNDRDLRITVIGKEHVFAFWRRNRKGDFRASGSGAIVYETGEVEAECRYCAELCRRHNFDSMAFDLLYDGGKFVIVEMSYAFNDQAIFDAPGHFVVSEGGAPSYVDGHVWPQDLMVQYVQQQMGAEMRSTCAVT